MRDLDPNLFEKELADMRPARPPEALMRRLVEARPKMGRSYSFLSLRQPGNWPLRVRWATAGAAALLSIFLAVALSNPKREPVPAPGRQLVKAGRSTLNADNIEIDRQLLASFDTITQMPDGEPVRLRCRQWLDSVVVRDSRRGVEIERQEPRLEVVPIAFETY